MSRSLWILALLVGCASDPAAPTDAMPADDATEAAVAGDKLFDTQFAQVCRGTAGQPAAAAYDTGPGIRPFLTMTSDDGVEYRGTSAGTFPDGWRVRWPSLPDAQLVVCAHRISATPVEVCEGYEDDDSGVQWSVQTHDAVYNYVVRQARTAEVVGTTKFEVSAGGCPRFSMFQERATQPQPSYPTPTAGQIEVFVRPFVRGD